MRSGSVSAEHYLDMVTEVKKRTNSFRQGSRKDLQIKPKLIITVL